MPSDVSDTRSSSGRGHNSLGFDPDVLRERYRRERDKRIRPDGEDQYLTTEGRFAHYADDDPFASPDFGRAPITGEIDVAVIGGGLQRDVGRRSPA